MRMFKTIFMTILITFFVAGVFVIKPVEAEVEIGDQPRTKGDGGKWQIAYCESENFITYTRSLIAIVEGLAEKGWIDDLTGFDQIAKKGDSKAIWNWLASREVSPYLQFVDNGFYNLREPEVDGEKIIERLRDEDDIDLIIVMGSAAGSLLSDSRHDTNIFVFAASNAVRAGIIASAEDSGKDNVWAHMDEQRFDRQLRAFYDIVNFKKLGMVYEDSPNARIYSAVNEVENLAREKGFEIVCYHVQEPRTAQDYPEYYRKVKEAYQKLSTQVDAVYVTIASLESKKLPELFQPLYQQKIPIFSQLGNIEVENGALLTVSVMDETNIGRFGADNISKCLLGVKPRQLEQVFQSSPQITLNAGVAKKIGFKLPFELIIVVDKVYP